MPPVAKSIPRTRLWGAARHRQLLDPGPLPPAIWPTAILAPGKGPSHFTLIIGNLGEIQQVMSREASPVSAAGVGDLSEVSQVTIGGQVRPCEILQEWGCRNMRSDFE